jgi:hypothetical protein
VLRTANMKLVSWQLERIMVEVLVFGIVTPVPSASMQASKVTNVLKMRHCSSKFLQKLTFPLGAEWLVGETKRLPTC